ncbi:MAG TPA: glycosyltransferase family 39 protein, partial [Thermoanaerobaculia bacterium]
VRLLGVDHEVTGRYYLDEGTYYHHATAIDDGQLLVHTFVYPHFLYYADALVLWVAARFPAVVAAGALRLYGVQEPLAVAWILLRALVAVLSALTTLPVYAIGRRLGGGAAAALGAVLLILSPLYNDGSHLNICDVPSAFFATVCLAIVARLLERETTAAYLLAGLAAGVAAGTKYPAGVAAVAIAAVWLRHRIASRRWSSGLVGAALAAVAGLLAVTPSLAVFPRLAVSSQRGLFFGVQQYGRGGWLGVMPDSNALYYAQQLLASFGWPLALLGLSGLFALPQERRRLALWLLPYPVVFLALLVSMNMVVKRNLYPVVPIAAALLGAGVAAWIARLPRLAARFPRWPARATAPLAVALVLLCLWPAGDSVARQEVGYVSRTTREEALDWIRRHVPKGAGIVKESYTPDFAAGEYDVLQIRFAGRLTPAELHDPQRDYLLLSSAAYGRFLDPDALVKPHQKEIAQRYKTILDGLTPIEEWTPGEMQLGPLLQLYRLDPEPATCKASGTLAATDAFVPDGRMRTTDDAPLEYELPGQWSLFK